MAETRTHVGGSMAPPLDARRLAEYRELAEDAPEQIHGAMTALLDMADLYLGGPAAKSAGKSRGTPHPSGLGNVVPLEAEEVERLWDAVPWDEELQMFATVFDRIDPAAEKPLRDAAFHLLWLGRELFLDREPRFAPPK